MASAEVVAVEASRSSGRGGFSDGTVAALGEVRQEDEEASVQAAGSIAKGEGETEVGFN